MKRLRATQPKDFETELAKTLADHNKQSAVDGITKIQPKLHFIKFSGDYTYQRLEEKIGKIKINANPPRILPEYRIEAYKKFEGGYLTFFLSPKKPYLPSCKIQTTASKKDFLTKVEQLLPGLKLSMAEYAVDLFCQDNLTASLLFWIIKRYVYVPYADKSMLYGGQEINGKNMSFVCRVRAVKFYERGEDEDKIEIPGTNKKGWHEEKINRVRLEYTAEGNILQQKGLNSLQDLVSQPKFKEIFSNKIKFKKFLDTAGRFPQYWEGYSAADLNGNLGAFHDEYVENYKAGTKNLSQYIENDVILGELDDRIRDKAANFDFEWANQTG